MMHSEILESLLQSTHRLTREAATSTGSSTPSASWRAMSVLEAEGAKRIGELAVACRVSQPGMTKVVADLAEKEYVSRIADTADARAWLIAPTRAGLAALAAWRSLLAETLQPRFGALSERDWATLRRAADILTAHLDAPAVAA